MESVWNSHDTVGEALNGMRMSAVVYCRSDVTAPWGVSLPPMQDCLLFHFMSAGECVLEHDTAGTRTLTAGEFVLVPHGARHRILSAPGADAPDLFSLPREMHGERFEVLRFGGGGAPATLICGAIRFSGFAARRLVAMLPALVSMPAGSRAQALLQWIGTESLHPQAGGEAVIARLADVLVIEAIRHWIAQSPAECGWLGALKDPQIGRALALVHGNAQRSWTLEELAGTVAMSRSAFSARFTELVGEPAMQYVRNWKMHVAADCLREENLALIEVAERVGYQSEAAFCRAFKGSMGVAPGAMRTRGLRAH